MVVLHRFSARASHVALGSLLAVSLLACGRQSAEVGPVPPKNTSPASASDAPRSVVIGYSLPGADNRYPPAVYDYGVYTHIARCFLHPHADGRISTPQDYWNQDLARLAKQNGVKLLASIGGGARDANNWLGMARNGPARTRFFNELEALVEQHSYDGVDIDWEPSAKNNADRDTYTDFMKALRARFPNWIITTALGTGEWNARFIDWKPVAESVDYINLMTYTFAGPWKGRSAHNANLYRAKNYNDADGLDADTNLRAVTQKYGVPPEKLLLGLAFFGLQFSTDKMGEPFAKDAQFQGQEVDYSGIALRAESDQYRVSWDEGARVPYLERKSGGHTISFDDPRAIEEKCLYAKDMKLSGVFNWYVGADVVRGRPVLQESMASALGLKPAEPPSEYRRSFYDLRLREAKDLEQRVAQLHAELVRISPKLQAEVGPVPKLATRAKSSDENLDQKLRVLDREVLKLSAAHDALSHRLKTLPIELLRGKPVTAKGRTLLVSNFDTGKLDHALGGQWRAEFDTNGLGTTLSPQPLVPSTGGAAGSRHALRIWGHYGKSQPPWPRAFMHADLGKADLSGFGGLRFWAKGNGKTYHVVVRRESVRDYAHFYAEFRADQKWTQISIDFRKFHQPDWAARIAPAWFDVTGISFSPSSQFNNEPYDVWIDSVELVKDP